MSIANIVGDLEKLRHMLGVDPHRKRKHWAYRNYYNSCESTVPSMQRLEAAGLVEQYRPDYWRATKAGCKAVGLTEKETQRALYGD